MSITLDGVKSGLSYVAKTSEDEWLALPADRRESIQQTVLQAAIEQGSEIACIQLVPDELLSTTGAVKPYIGWQQRTRIKKPNPYEDVDTAVQALVTLIKGSKASQTDYVYIPTALAEAVADFCRDNPGFKG